MKTSPMHLNPLVLRCVVAVATAVGSTELVQPFGIHQTTGSSRYRTTLLRQSEHGLPSDSAVLNGLPILRELTRRVKAHLAQHEMNDGAGSSEGTSAMFHEKHRIATLRTAFLRSELGRMQAAGELASSFYLALEPSYRVAGFVVENCKVTASNHQALILEFCPTSAMTSKTDPCARYSNAVDRSSPATVLESGSSANTTMKLVYKTNTSIYNLHKDLVVLDVIRAIDQLWKQHGFDLLLVPYRGVATGEDEGMLEVVNGAETFTKIIVEGLDGKPLQTGKFDGHTHIKTWLDSRIQRSDRESDFRRIQERFQRSSAGYCVLQYLLRFDDRHPSNIMLLPNGNVFHSASLP